MIALAHGCGLLQVGEGQHLVGDHGPEQFLPHGQLGGGQVALADQADIALAQGHVGVVDNHAALERVIDGDYVAEQFDLGRHKDGPRRQPFAAYAHDHPAHGLRRAFEGSCQILVALGQAQARVKIVDLDLISTLGLAGGQVVFNREFKKALGHADKLFRRCKRVSPAISAECKQGARRQRAQTTAAQTRQERSVAGFCRFCVHDR